MFSFLFSDSSYGDPYKKYVPDFKSYIKPNRDGVMGSYEKHDHEPTFVITFDVNDGIDWTEYRYENRYVNVVTWADSLVDDRPVGIDCVNTSERDAINDLLIKYAPELLDSNDDDNIWSVVNFTKILKDSIKAHILYEVEYDDNGNEVKVTRPSGLAYVDLNDITPSKDFLQESDNDRADIVASADNMIMNAIEDMNVFRNKLAIDVTAWSRTYSDYFGGYQLIEFDRFNAVSPDDVCDLYVTLYGEYDYDVDYQESEEVPVEEIVQYYTEDIKIDHLEFNVLTAKPA